MSDVQPQPQAPPNAPETQDAPPKKKRTWRRWLFRAGITAFVLLIMMSVMAVGTEYYTSRPDFCASCHIMHPYYDSWSHDVHADAGGAICVDCHYRPGERHTIMAKFRGLSQATSYFSGRYGAGRPRAHASNESCLTSGCHGDQKFMNKVLELGSTTFVHAKHLDPDSEMIRTLKEEFTSLTKSLNQRVGAERMAEVDEISEQFEPVPDRNRRLKALLAGNTDDDTVADVLRYAELKHTDLRIDQLGSLKCASCHQFDATLKNHFAVQKTTCFTCHFMNQPFNANTGECLSCHEPPTGPVAVHYASASAGGGSDGPATMDHSVILENNVDCVSCHADVLSEKGTVLLSACQNCHDQARFLKDFEHRNAETVREYHHVHAGKQHARCNDCHRVIQHKLAEAVSPHDIESLLDPVRQDCQFCHPNHHMEQVDMLLGRGGFTKQHTQVSNPMAGARASCRACHTDTGTDVKGDLVVTSTLTSCRGCHSEDYQQLFERWHDSIHARLEEADMLLQKVRSRTDALDENNAKDKEMLALVDRAGENIHFVSAANGLHNRNYAMMLLDQAINDLDSVLAELPTQEQ